MRRSAFVLCAALAFVSVAPGVHAQGGGPNDVALLAHLPLPRTESNAAYVHGAVRVVGDRAYVLTEDYVTFTTHRAHRSYLDVVDLGGGQMARRGRFDTPYARVSELAVAGDHAYVATAPEGVTSEGAIRVVDVRDADEPVQVGRIAINEWFEGLAVGGGYAYATHRSALLVVDVTTATQPQLVTTIPLVNGGTDVQLLGARAYVAVGGGMNVYDLTDPRLPVLVGAFESTDRRETGSSGELAIAGDRAYLTRYDTLVVLDISTPNAPREIGRVTLPNNAYRVAVAGSLAYVSLNAAGLAVVDVTDSAAPRLVAETLRLGWVGDVAPVGSDFLASVSGGVSLARYPAVAFRVRLPWAEQSGNRMGYPPGP